jgi:hypothetical protein
MSVTFTAELGPIIGFSIACCREAALVAPRYGTYDDAVADLVKLKERDNASGARREPLPGCAWPELCPDGFLSIRALEAQESPSVNVSGVNAALLLQALGYREPFDSGPLVGSAAAEEFGGRVLTALALAPADDGAPWHETSPRFTDCGRWPSYLQDRLEHLHELADWCAQHHRAIQWA